MGSLSAFRLHWVSWCLTAFVFWGVWNVQTDFFPLSDRARPSWYVYGWPVCFGTSNRGRFRLHLYPFDRRALVLDLAISVAVVASTCYAAESLVRHLPRVSMLDMLAIVTGLSFMLFVLSSEFHRLLEWLLAAVPPPEGWSALGGNTRLTGRLPRIVTLPLALGLSSTGFALFKLPFVYIRARREV